MTHSQPMKDSAGTFTLIGDTRRQCRGCGRITIHTVHQWDSICGGYEDFKFTCAECGAARWVDGADS